MVNRTIFKKLINFKVPNLQYNSIAVNNDCCSTDYKFTPKLKKVCGPEELKNYQFSFQEVVNYLTSFDKIIHPEVNQYLKKILQYNLFELKILTGPLVIATYKNFAHPKNQTSENMRLAYIMACVNDVVTAKSLIVDDILDSSTTRGNKTCWYKKENVGLAAVTHATAMANGGYVILNNFLSRHSNYIPILKLIQELNHKYTLCLIFDNLSENKFKFFTKKKYNIEAYHRADPFILIPLRIGMYLADVCDPRLHSEISSFSFVLAQYICAQNDILDCYGKFEETGKHGTDIMSGKCTWLAIQTLMDANPSQIKLFKEHYGKSDHNSQNIIINLYEKLDIFNKFLIYEQESYNHVRSIVENMSESIPKELMYQIINSTYENI